MDDWKIHKVTFGNKHKGETIFSIILNDPQYIKWVLDVNVPMSDEEKGCFECAIEHININYPERLE